MLSGSFIDCWPHLFRFESERAFNMLNSLNYLDNPAVGILDHIFFKLDKTMTNAKCVHTQPYKDKIYAKSAARHKKNLFNLKLKLARLRCRPPHCTWNYC